MNDNSEIYGPCRHRSKFHRFPCTVDRNTREKDLVPYNFICCSNNTCLNLNANPKRTPLKDRTNEGNSQKTVISV